MAQILQKLKSFLKKRNKKNVDSGSTFKTFVDSLPKVKNSANIYNVLYFTSQLYYF